MPVDMVVQLTNDDMLVQCPRCKRWPMAATTQAPFKPRKILFTCGNCRTQAEGQFPTRVQRERPPPSGQGRDA